MASSSGFSRKNLGEKFRLRRSNSRDADISQFSSSALDMDSSFATSSGTSTNEEEGEIKGNNDSRAKLGSLNQLGAKMRSFSSGGKRSVTGERKTTTTTASPSPAVFPASQSKTSLVDDNRKSNRNSRLLSSVGGRPKSEALFTPSQSYTSAIDDEPDEQIDQQKASLRRPRLSISGLSGHFIKSSSQASPRSNITPLPTDFSNTNGQGDFNLRSFRNVRRESSTGSFLTSSATQPPTSNLNAVTGPMSSASVYAPSPLPPPSRQESFVSAEEYLSRSSHSPLQEDAYTQSPQLDVRSIELSHSESSKPNSPRSEAVRVMGGSIPAGRFRKVTGSSRYAEEGTVSPAFRSGAMTPTDGGGGIQRSTRPSSPFMHPSSSTSEALAALEAEMVKGRTTPLMYMSQGDESRRGSSVAALGISEADGSNSSAFAKDSSYFYRHPGEINGKTVSPLKGSLNSRRQEGDTISPPILPWMVDERGSKGKEQNRRLSTSNTNQENLSTSILSLKPAIKSDDLLPLSNVDKEPNPDDRSPGTPTVDADFLASAVQASPYHRIFTTSPTMDDDLVKRQSMEKEPQSSSVNADPTTRDRGSRRGSQLLPSVNNKKANNENNHRRSGSSPLEYKSASTVWPHHRRFSSSTSPNPPPVPSKADELLSFHKRQAPSLSATQSQKDIQPIHFQRIAWPSPPCVKLSYFSQLTALHQHSLFEQHRKAAEHALAEYLRLMAGVVPPEAMTQPGPLFGNTEGSMTLNGYNGSRAGSQPHHHHQHVRSRSISVPGLHGGSQQTRRRSTASHVEEPVPPLPTEKMIEKLEERAQGSRNGTSRERQRRSLQTPTATSSSSSSNGHSNATQVESLYNPEILRRPSAKFMNPQHTTEAPIEALDGINKYIAA